MATLQELLAEYNLDESAPSQTKVASAAQKQNEVDQVLENLGLSGADEGVTKVANEQTENKGDRMSLTNIYEELFGENAPVAGQPTTEKTASAEEGNEATELMGQLTAHYFDVAKGNFLDKVAESVETETSDANEAPMKHLGNSSTLGNTIGKPAEAGMPVNNSASGGAHLQVTTGGTSPYSLKEMALKKQILKRLQAASVGAFKD